MVASPHPRPHSSAPVRVTSLVVYDARLTRAQHSESQLILTQRKDGHFTEHSEASMEQKREYLFKVLVFGEWDSGKTALVKRYVHNVFSESYRKTVNISSHSPPFDSSSRIDRRGFCIENSQIR